MEEKLFEIGQIFTEAYPPEAAVWCSKNRAYIEEVEQVENTRRFRIAAIPEPTLDDMKDFKFSEINNAYEIAVSVLKSEYPQSEVSTFDKQESEAMAWLSDNSADTPIIDMLVAARHVDKPELVSRIIKKAKAFNEEIGYLTGQCQRYKDLVNSATTIAAVKSIKPIFSRIK